MGKRKKKNQKLSQEKSPKPNKKGNFIVQTSSEEDDMRLLEPFIDEESSNNIEWVATTMYKLRKEAQETELTVAKYLWRERVIYITQAPFKICVPGEGKHYYFADFYIPSLDLIIELDGSQHRNAEGLISDAYRDAAFSSIGIKTLRIPNKDVYSGKYKEIIPIPSEEYLKPIKLTYLKEGESAITREQKINRVKQLLKYK